MASLVSHHVMPFLAVIGLMMVGTQAYMFNDYGYGYHGMGGDDYYYDDDLVLTCSNNVTDAGTGVVTDALTVTISRRNQDDVGYPGLHHGAGLMDPMFGMHGLGYGGYGGYGGGYGGQGGFGYGGGYGGYGGYGGGLGGGQGRGGLKAEISLLSSAMGTGTAAFTVRARTEDGCSEENFGEVLSAPRQQNKGMHLGFGYPYGGGDSRTSGIVKTGIKINMNLQTISIDELSGFTNLADLAGRGFVICSGSDYDWDWDATCEGPYFGCCTLKYDDRPQTIDLYDHTGGKEVY